MTKHDLILVGPVPPPYGGISVHVERLVPRLEKRGLRVGILNHYKSRSHPNVIAALNRNPLRYWWHMRRQNAPVVHYHHARWSTLLAAALARRSKDETWIATFHGHTMNGKLESRFPGVAASTRWAIGRFDRVITASEEVAEVIRRHTEMRALVLPAYLPPPGGNAGGPSPEPYSEPTVVVSAYGIRFLETGDEYGLDVAVDAFVRASNAVPDLRFELFLANPPARGAPRRYLNRILEPIEEAIGDGTARLHIGKELVPALRPGSVYLRPTRWEGDAVSVREALDCGVPVIASDVAGRPPGTRVVPLHDIEGWGSAIGSALEAEKPNADGEPPSRPADHADILMNLYVDPRR